MMIYFDYAATAPIDHEALEIYNEAARSVFGNTRSLHDVGSRAEQILSTCRNELADLFSAPAEGIYFTSGGTESNLLSITSLAKSHSAKGKHVLISMGEHASVFSAVRYLEELGFNITEIPFTREGQVDVNVLSQSIQQDTILCCVQHVNSEMGTIQPIHEIADVLHQKGILLHCDCVQSFGKLPIHTVTPFVDSLSVSSHKVYGPKGVGAAYIDPRLSISPLFPGFHHENGFRGGTVNVPGIAAFTFAAQKLYGDSTKQKEYALFRDAFIEELRQGTDIVEIFQSHNKTFQLPQIIGLRICGVEGQYAMLECNRKGYAISTGSACQTGHQHPSAVMRAMGISTDKAKEFIRISFGKETVLHDVIDLARCLKSIGSERLFIPN
jgi:cysteine desulfurase